MSILARTLAILALSLALLGVTPDPALAGCGCDHPPPAWAPVMPAFGSPGREIRIDALDQPFQVGASYTVQFHPTNGQGSSPPLRTAVAEFSDHLMVTIPTIAPGPVKLQVTGSNYDQQYDHSLFTAMPPAHVVKDKDLVAMARDYEAAVGADGTLLIPIDLTAILDATQFAFMVADRPVTFTANDVVFYNADGVDLTLFTLAVDDGAERQWGSYFGWKVEGDSGIFGTVYKNKIKKSDKISTQSDLLTYWRHEFHTYAAAHAPGGSHEVDANGFHPDGTLHIDHDHVVIAIRAMERDPQDPTNAAKFEPLEIGARLDLVAATVKSENPIEPDPVAATAASALMSGTWSSFDD